ncbi:MAG: nitroreductase family protein [Anaerolineales bacterium]
METMEAITNRRSVRGYTQEPIPEALLRQLLEATVNSSSSGNVQPWGFVVIQDTDRLRALRSLAPGIIGYPTALVVIALDFERAELLGGALGPKLAWIDIGLATQTLLLAAFDQGLGACPIGSFHRKAVALFLDMPPHVLPVLLVTLGHPKALPPSRGRRPVEDVCFVDRWGAPL